MVKLDMTPDMSATDTLNLPPSFVLRERERETKILTKRNSLSDDKPVISRGNQELGSS